MIVTHLKQYLLSIYSVAIQVESVPEHTGRYLGFVDGQEVVFREERVVSQFVHAGSNRAFHPGTGR